jgi:AcrR family transcriptional regulator
VASDDPTPRRERLINAAATLFGELGYRRTTVGQIEEEAGLSGRSGAFYRHFASKEAVLSAVVDRWVGDVRGFPEELAALLPLEHLEDELRVVARGSMQVLDRQRPLFLALARDPGAMPLLIRRVHCDLVTVGYEQMTRSFRSQLRRRGAPVHDAEAMAAVALSSLAHYHQDLALYGEPPGGVDRDAFVDAWIQAWAAALSQKASETDTAPLSPTTRRS